MKTCVLISVILLGSVLDSQFLWTLAKVAPAINGDLFASIEARGDTDGLKGKKLSSQYEAVQSAIKRESLKLRIKNLREVVSDAETETRIWVGFGLAYPRCFILQQLSGKERAVYIASKGIGGQTALGVKGESLITKTVLSTPKSGWDEFDRFLKERGIDSPIKLSLDDKHIPDPDEELIVVEVKSGEVYSMVFFFLYTESNDGRKALAVCQRIEREFNIQMGC